MLLRSWILEEGGREGYVDEAQNRDVIKIYALLPFKLVAVSFPYRYRSSVNVESTFLNPRSYPHSPFSLSQLCTPHVSGSGKVSSSYLHGFLARSLPVSFRVDLVCERTVEYMLVFWVVACE